MRLTEKRTQVYLPAELHGRVQRYARQRGVSLAAVIRLSLEQSLERPPRLSKRAYDHDPIWSVVGIARSRDGNLSVHHDQYLYGKSHPRLA